MAVRLWCSQYSTVAWLLERGAVGGAQKHGCYSVVQSVEHSNLAVRAWCSQWSTVTWLLERGAVSRAQ